MNASQIIETMGGRAEVMKITGLTKGRVSQWETGDYIPRPWLMVFHKIHPRKVPHPDRLGITKRQGRSNA